MIDLFNINIVFGVQFVVFLFFRLTFEECSVIKFKLSELIVIVVSQLPVATVQLRNIDFILNAQYEPHTKWNLFYHHTSSGVVQVQKKKRKMKIIYTDPALNNNNFFFGISIKSAITIQPYTAVTSCTLMWYINENLLHKIDNNYFYVIQSRAMCGAGTQQWAAAGLKHKCKWCLNPIVLHSIIIETNQTSICCPNGF